MAISNDIITKERLRELLFYNPRTGVFIWRMNTRRAGLEAGYLANSQGTKSRIIHIGDRWYKAHRLAWLYMTCVWPLNEIDHKDGDAWNNRWSNLREATHQQNRSNNRHYVTNKLGVLGVRRLPSGKYYAKICSNGKNKYLGCYKTLEEARRVRRAAAREFFGEFAPQ